MTQRKEIRVFVSSPSDCDFERDAVSRVLDELNRTVGDRERLFFQAIRCASVGGRVEMRHAQPW